MDDYLRWYKLYLARNHRSVLCYFGTCLFGDSFLIWRATRIYEIYENICFSERGARRARLYYWILLDPLIIQSPYVIIRDLFVSA